MKKIHVFFSGHVQGVGFRYTVEHYAHRFAVKGFVRNTSDGRVELVAEGSEEELKAFYQKIISGSLGGYIHNNVIDWFDATDQFDSFAIRY